MRIAFVQSYPIYHDHLETPQWLAMENRDRWIPGILASDGHEVELWAAAAEHEEHVSSIAGLGEYAIRLFRSSGGARTKFHESPSLVDHARDFRPDLVILKGTDGGVGLRLLERYVRPERIPFTFIVGGKHYTRRVAEAAAVLYETDEQKQDLRHPGSRFWRRRVAANRLIRLPKTVDTELFRPLPDVPKEWDVISVGRLVRRLKSYGELGQMSRLVRVAVAGTGPDEAELRAAFPRIAWLGHVDHHELPRVLNGSRIFLHSGHREYYPRVIVEAASCGLACVAFADTIARDVLPASWGLRVDRRDYSSPILELLGDEERRTAMGLQSREHAEVNFSRENLRAPLQRMMALVGQAHPAEAFSA